MPSTLDSFVTKIKRSSSLSRSRSSTSSLTAPFAGLNIDDESVQTKRSRLVFDDDDCPSPPKKQPKSLDADWRINVRDSMMRTPQDPDYDPTTLYIPQQAIDNMSDFEKQYWGIKSKYYDTVVFFKKGKFYELYDSDAELSHREFDLKISGGHTRGSMRMTGVPGASFDEWANRFVARGFKVAKVDQIETQSAKNVREKKSNVKDKIIRRELTCVLTSGTLLAPMDDLASYALAIWVTGDSISTVFVDTSTARIQYCTFVDSQQRYHLETLLSRINPKEFIYDKLNLGKSDIKLMKSVCSNAAWSNIPFEQPKNTMIACIAEYWPGFPDQIEISDDLLCTFYGLLSYLQRIKLDSVFAANQVSKYNILESNCFLNLDGQSLHNLNIFGTKPCLFSILDFCATPMGKRLLHKWLCHPLANIPSILSRQKAVLELCESTECLKSCLASIPDLDRIIGRIQIFSNRPNDLSCALKAFDSIYNSITSLKRQFNSEYILNILDSFPELAPILNEFEKRWVVCEKKPKPGFISEYDQALVLKEAVTAKFDKYLAQIRREFSTNAQYVNIGKDLNQLEVPVALKVPNSWRKVSGTKSVARYYTNEINSLNVELTFATETILALERDLEKEMLKQFNQSNSQWKAASKLIAELDVLFSLASAARCHGFSCAPEFSSSDVAFLDLRGMRHPCFPKGEFIANDTVLTEQNGRAMIITGPNMGGKSTLLRQTGLAIVMAQIGSLLPAESCKMAPFDAVFTRIGARDNLVAGQSTFLVELNETATILNKATSRTLVLMDELGRGTSTFDGQAIALSTLQHCVFKLNPCMMFATHYVGLTQETLNWSIQHSHMLCVEKGNTVTFLFKLVPGIAPRSHGMNVARMAGLPEAIVKHASSVSSDFESHQQRKQVEKTKSSNFSFSRLALFTAILSSDCMPKSLFSVIEKIKANCEGMGSH